MDKRAERRTQIEQAAFAVLDRVGYQKASMLEIAKQAKASNETLYSWYGNKQTLFSSLIASNAQAVKTALDAAIASSASPRESLVEIGKQLLQFTATKQAIVVNRAAVADAQDTGRLAEAIEETARKVMYQRLEQLMHRLEQTGAYQFEDGSAAAARTFVCLILGELQIQQAFGAIPPLSDTEISDRSTWACDLFDRLYMT